MNFYPTIINLYKILFFSLRHNAGKPTALVVDKNIEKINQIELDNEFAYISCTVKEEEKIECKGWLGIDRNTTGHCVVNADNKNNRVIFLGKAAQHIHKIN